MRLRCAVSFLTKFTFEAGDLRGFFSRPVAGEVVRLVCSPNRENIPLTCAEEFCVQVYGADQFGNKLPKVTNQEEKVSLIQGFCFLGVAFFIGHWVDC